MSKLWFFVDSCAPQAGLEGGLLPARGHDVQAAQRGAHLRVRAALAQSMAVTTATDVSQREEVMCLQF